MVFPNLQRVAGRRLPLLSGRPFSTRQAPVSTIAMLSASHRTFSKPIFSQYSRTFSKTVTRQNQKTVSITYIDDQEGTETVVQAEIGQNLLQVAHDNNVELEGACGGELACSTCHLVFEQEMYDTLPDKEEDEEDMLDLAMELTETSRLGCQILVREDMEGMKVRIPDDGF